MRQWATRRGDILRMFAMAWAASLLFGQAPARASGCHVSDRPALFSGLSWDRWQDDGPDREKPAAVRLPAAPSAAFAAMPCHKDVSTTSQPASESLGADLTPLGPIGEPTAREFLPVGSVAAVTGPTSGRLDRPPRSRPIVAGC